MPRRNPPPVAVTDDELLTSEQVAAILQVTPRMVRDLWQRRELGGYKVGKLVRHRRSDVESYLEDRRVAWRRTLDRLRT